MAHLDPGRTLDPREELCCSRLKPFEAFSSERRCVAAHKYPCASSGIVLGPTTDLGPLELSGDCEGLLQTKADIAAPRIKGRVLTNSVEKLFAEECVVAVWC